MNPSGAPPRLRRRAVCVYSFRVSERSGRTNPAVWASSRHTMGRRRLKCARRSRTPEPAMSIGSAALLLFLVMDPVGNVPFFIATLKSVEPARQRRVVIRELLIALAVMVFFLFAG